ncbi:hypothetical protein DXG01_011543 [Tephrocybe rancida]|nr:hypothetical protein DXG01_011543 [Tephrocybe rancida]
MSSPDFAPIEPALISKCVLVNEEIPRTRVQEHMYALFHHEENWSHVPGGSHFQRWYRTMAMGPEAAKINDKTRINKGLQGRLIAWKTGKPFEPSNLFFRSLDTGKLLPMNLADFNIQMYGHPTEWRKINELKDVTKDDWETYMMFGMIHEILMLRNMHDRGGGDIPVILFDWQQREITLAMDYWVGLSKGEWTEEERNAQYAKVNGSICKYILPCFAQADLLVRSLLQDPAVGYVAPFIVMLPAVKDGRASVLFTDPDNCPPQEMLASWPVNCNGPNCPKAIGSCGAFDFKNCRSLAKGSKMVRKSVWPTGRVKCNFWTCQIEHAPDAMEPTTLQRCQRCKEALYCSAAHQVGS